jgi:hypothetical protein
MAKQEQTVSDDVWKRKDYLSAKQTAANVTSYVFEGKEISADDFILFAGKIFDWLFQEQTPLPDLKPSKCPVLGEPQELPTPTLEQQKVLELIAAKLNRKVDDNLKRSVLDWVNRTYAKTVYPSKESNVEKFVESCLA